MFELSAGRRGGYIMSKNKYKYNSLKSKPGILHKEKFSVANSKTFLMVLIVCFHILPLIFLAFGEAGKQMLVSTGMLILNPVLIMAILLFYGVKVGFNFKMPLLTAFLSTASVGMYYLNPEQQAYLFYLFQTVIVMFFVYFILALIFVAAGAAINQKA